MNDVRQWDWRRAGQLSLALTATLALAACLDNGKSNSAANAVASSGSASFNTAAANQAPTITGNPATAARADLAYTFQPAASDADGDVLAFSISNKPAWAVFNTTTGALTGTPKAADVGTYANITISVSDGVASKSLTAFAVTVNQISTGSASLSWMPPTEHIDGTVLLNLAGFRIFYSTDPSSLGGQQITVANPGLTRYIVENLPPATWYFSVKAYTSAGVESDFSGVASKKII